MKYLIIYISRAFIRTIFFKKHFQTMSVLLGGPIHQIFWLQTLEGQKDVPVATKSVNYLEQNFFQENINFITIKTSS